MTGQDFKDEIILPAFSTSSETERPLLLVFFITGNPGLIEYYRDFLQEIQALLIRSESHRHVIIHGISLAGFELQPKPSKRLKDPPYNLAEVVQEVKTGLARAISQSTSQNTRSSEPTEVLLIGHSVGSYIALEIIAWWQQTQNEKALPDQPRKVHSAENIEMTIKGAICLFPTIVGIAKSPRGKWITWFLLIPMLQRIVSILAKLLRMFVPTSLIHWLLRISIMDKPAANTTAAWMKSPHGLTQTVCLGRHEMLEIVHDKWQDDLWGRDLLDEQVMGQWSGSTQAERLNLFFLWGQHDHWVDNLIRDKLISTRAWRGGKEKDSRPWMEIDRSGLRHAFCTSTNDSKKVAVKVVEWMREIL